MKRIIGIMMSFLMFIMAKPVFAVNPSGDSNVIGGENVASVNSKDNLKAGDSSTTIEGVVKVVIIKAIVPTKVMFILNANNTWSDKVDTTGNSAFITSPFKFENKCNAPLTFSVDSIVPSAENPGPPVVDANKFSTLTEAGVSPVYWKHLDKAQTESNIAFGFTAIQDDTAKTWLKFFDNDGVAKLTNNASDATDVWFKTTGKQKIGNIGGLASASLMLKARYGMAWDNVSDRYVKYDVVYGVTIAE